MQYVRNSSDKKTWVWIDTSDKLKNALGDISGSSSISVDTEYDSLRYFREVLCLIQIEAERNTYLFDPFDRFSFSFLGEALADNAILKIFHAGDNDIRILKRDYGFTFTNIFDTQKAAAILGCRHLSLPALVLRYLSIEFEKEKKMQRSKWNARPLQEEQILYAVQDTMYLKALHRVLDQELQQKNLKAKVAKLFENMSALTWKEKAFDPHKCKRVKGYEALTELQQACMNRLYRWRFHKAKETNMALFRILSDHYIIDLARTGATSVEMLMETEILSPEKVTLYGQEIVRIIRQCMP